MTDKITRNEVLNVLDPERVAKSDITAMADRIVDFLNDHAEKTREAIEEIRDLLKKEMAESTGTEFGSIKGQLNDLLGKTLSDLEQRAGGGLARLEARVASIRDGIDGKDADPEAIAQIVRDTLFIPKVEDLQNDIPKLGSNIRDSLELLQGDERLDVTAIKGLEEYLKKHGNKPYLMGGGPHYFAGSGVSIEGNVISATGSGTFGIITVTGTIDDSNKSFTAASTPTIVVVNGVSYRHGKGVSISGTAITLDNAVGTGGDIYAL